MVYFYGKTDMHVFVLHIYGKLQRHVALQCCNSFLFRAILSQFTGEQMERFEFFRRSRFKKSEMRKVCLFCIFYAFLLFFPLYSVVFFKGLVKLLLMLSTTPVFFFFFSLASVVSPTFVIWVVFILRIQQPEMKQILCTEHYRCIFHACLRRKRKFRTL